MRVSATGGPGYGFWYSGSSAEPDAAPESFNSALQNISKPVFVVDAGKTPAVATWGRAELYPEGGGGDHGYRLRGFVPPLDPQNFGDPDFKSMLGIRYPYVAGAMANGITSVEMVTTAARAGMVGFFGAAGLGPSELERAIDRLQRELSNLAFGMNLIHSPDAPELESRVVDLYLQKGVRLVSASAYLRLTPHIVRYRVKGIYRDANDQIVVPNKIVAKVSRTAVASRFLGPPPGKILEKLLQQDLITREEAALGAHIPMADAITAEADSGGHTDNQPAIALLATMIALRDRICAQYDYPQSIPVGLAGGIATPAATAAAFSMGAGYVLTGSVNQSCVEAGVCRTVRQMLAEAGQGDVTMAPSADMFEKGGRVQVLKRGTMFAMRASRLYDYYMQYGSFEQIPEDERSNIEEKFLRRSFDAEWEETRKFFQERNPAQVARAEKDPRHKMALVFRAYLGRSSMWAISGEPERKVDYQVWCGPAIGAFNEWVKDSFLEKAENRDFATIAMNLLVGAAVLTRANWLQTQGICMLPEVVRFSPMRFDDLTALAGSPGADTGTGFDPGRTGSNSW
ncbi:MAG: PfaD family polyunsaturated fatty acid/polyketide biosynthesis protein [Desulfobacteraceae bacterium]|nr:PfaD family polyunsaturated fatty acid/polyketide biosynthesis protein [Desulfobacteraceae bacterium]